MSVALTAQVSISELAAKSALDLVAWGQAALGVAGNYEEVKLLRDVADALRVLQKSQRAAQDAIDAATELKIRAEKRMADEHAKLNLHHGRPGKRSGDTTVSGPVKLSDIGLSKDESARLKALAETPAPILDAIIEAHKEQKVPLTSAGVTRASKAAADASWSPADIKANPLPTAADARKQAKEQGISVVGRDGRLYDGRSVSEEKADTEASARAYKLITPIQEIAEIGMTPEEYLAAMDIPRFGRFLDKTLHKQWEIAWPWLEKFNQLWRKHRAS